MSAALAVPGTLFPPLCLGAQDNWCVWGQVLWLLPSLLIHSQTRYPLHHWPLAPAFSCKTILPRSQVKVAEEVMGG